MKISGILCATTATTNEEYRKVLKRRNIWMMALFLVGVLIAGVAQYAEHNQKMALPDASISAYCGFGVGLALAGLILFVRNLMLMSNEEKLKQNRLQNADERLVEVGSKACRIALLILLFAIVAGGMIWAIFEPIMIKAMIFLLDIFFFSYTVAFVYYKRKM